MLHFDFEKAMAPGLVAGFDEAGLGPWAGPLVTAGVIFLSYDWGIYSFLSELNDSKKLTPQTREVLFDCITLHPQIIYTIYVMDNQELDRLTLKHALPLCYQRTLANFTIMPQSALIDGIRSPKFDIPERLIKKGDAQSLSIAAASILAKVTRDRLMDQAHEQFPHYGWNTNKGYGTAQHQEGLKMHGLCSLHRKSYAPIKQILKHSMTDTVHEYSQSLPE